MVDTRGPSTTVRLILMRHAKAAHPTGVDDVDRPLTDRGLADATAAGRALVELGVPDLVLCSTALRTRQTWAQVSAALADPPDARFEQTLFTDGAEAEVDLLASLEPGTRSVLVVGHEPTQSRTAVTLLAADADPAPGQELLHDGLPTAALVVLTVPEPWSAISPGVARLERVVVPRADHASTRRSP